MIQVTKNLYVESGMIACNVGCLVTEAGLVMIDTPMRPTDAVKLLHEIGQKGQIRYLINTEEHADHWQGSYFFPGILITSQNTRDKLAGIPVAAPVETVKHLDPQGIPLMKDYRIRLADITFNDNLTLHLGDHTVELFALPGHSVGGIGVYIPEEKVVFTTDIVFHKKKSWLHESDPEAWLRSLKKLSALDTRAVVPGHGPVTTKAVFDEEAGIIQKWIDAVKKAIQQGLSMEEATTQLPDQDPYPKQENTPMSEPELNKAIIMRLYQYYSK
jgi:cyclase